MIKIIFLDKDIVRDLKILFPLFSVKMEEQCDEDLPLSANIHEIRVRHHIFAFHPDVFSEVIYGSLILIVNTALPCEKTGSICQRKCNCRTENLETKSTVCIPDKIILDMKDLHIKSVSKIDLDSDILEQYIDPLKEKNNPSLSYNTFFKKKEELYFEIFVL